MTIFQSVFDIIGPVMVGPSSSHTAGAVRIGLAARSIFEEQPDEVDITFYGSFGHTYKGHGTDRALLAGALGLWEDDERLKDSFELARGAGLGFSFLPEDLGDVHENTVKMTFYLGEQGELATAPTQVIQGSSLGGGRILVTRIGGFDTGITLEAPTIVVMQKDLPGVISSVTAAVAVTAVAATSRAIPRSSTSRLAG